MKIQIPDQTIENFARSFTGVMHLFHNLASGVSRGANLSLAQYRVLMTVHHYGPMSINQLHERLNIAQSSASEMVDRLVRRGMLSRAKDPHDHRITIFRLTEKTHDILKKQKNMMQDVYRRVLEPLTSAEQQELSEAFEKILKLLQPTE